MHVVYYGLWFLVRLWFIMVDLSRCVDSLWLKNHAWRACISNGKTTLTIFSGHGELAPASIRLWFPPLAFSPASNSCIVEFWTTPDKKNHFPFLKIWLRYWSLRRLHYRETSEQMAYPCVSQHCTTSSNIQTGHVLYSTGKQKSLVFNYNGESSANQIQMQLVQPWCSKREYVFVCCR